MTDTEILEHYRLLVPFIAQLCGPSCEVLLHDISRPDDSVIAIENGFHSGRTIGCPMTDLAQKVVASEDYKEKDFLSNYSGSGKGKNFVSSTFYIKNGDRLIGLLCINRDMGTIIELEHVIERLKKQWNLNTVSPEIKENLDVPVPILLQNMVTNAIQDTGMLPERMSIPEKVALVHKLMEQGVLSMKGSVAEIARQLQISEPTVYRYIHRTS